jgi:DNA polymerase III subunit gamma/tau
VLEILGVADAELILETAESLVERDPKAALLAVEKLAASGRDVTQFMRDLAAHLRHLFVVQTLGEVPDTFAVTAEHTDRLSAQASRLAQGEVLRAIDLLAAGLAAVKDGSEPRIQLEMALLKASQPSSDLSLQALMFRIEQLEQRVQASGGASSRPAEPPPTSSEAAPPPPQAKARASAGAASAPAPAPAPVQAVAPQLDLQQVLHIWPAAVEVIGEENELLGAALAEAKPHSLEAGRLVIAFPPDSEFVRKKAEAKRDVVQRAIHGLTGASLAITFESNGDAAPPPPKTMSTEDLIESVKRDFAATEVTPVEEES